MMTLKENLLFWVTIINSWFSLVTFIAWLRNPQLLTLKKLENSPFMAFQICIHLLVWMILAIVYSERVIVRYVFKLKDQAIFYQKMKKNMILTYLLLIYLSDEEAFRSVPDFFVYIYHLIFFSAMSSFKGVFDYHCQNVLNSQVSYDLIPETKKKIQRIRGYYQMIKYIQILVIILSYYVFSDAGKLRLFSLYTPGLVVLIDWFLSYENLYYKYKTAMSINEKVITWTLNYCFVLTTVSMVIQIINFFLIFSKSGISLTFSFVHMYYMFKNFSFFFMWLKEFSKFWNFHKYKRMITNKFELRVFEYKAEVKGVSTVHKEECAIWLNTLEKARVLPCNHYFHLICLLQLVKSGDWKCPVCRSPFDQNRQQNQQEDQFEQLPPPPIIPVARFRRNINQINFYGLEDD